MQIEECVLTFKRLKDPSSPLPYNVISNHSRIPVLGGLFQSESQEAFSADQLQAIQREYMKYLELAHSVQVDSLVPVALPSKSDLYRFGNQIAGLLPATTRRSLAQAINRTHRANQQLRIVLNFYPNVLELLAVPWELITTALDLEDAASADLDRIDQLVERDFLLHNPRISLVRQIHGVGVQVASTIPQPFPVEALLAHPLGAPAIIDQDLVQAMFDSEHYFDEAGSLERLLQRMQAHQPRVVHLVAHGGPVEIEQGLMRYDLLLTHQAGFVRRVGAADLAPILANSAQLRLVVLHACYAAAQAGTLADADDSSPKAELDKQRGVVEGVALGLIRRGIPFVVAFQGEIRQDAAVIFSQVLYQQLARGVPLEFAVTQARLAITAHIPAGVVDWSLPVVYRGAIINDAQTNYDTFGDRNHRIVESLGSRPWFREGCLLFGVVALMIALVIPFYYPQASLLNIADSALTTINLLSRLGVVIPAILAILYRPYFQPMYLDGAAKRFLKITKFVGAYFGYGLAYSFIIGMYLYVFVVFGELIGQKPYNYLLTILLGIANIVLGNFFMRNVTRSQWALGIYDSTKEQIQNTIILMVGSLFFLLLLPFALNYVFNSQDLQYFLLTPVLAMMAAIGTLFAIIGSMEDEG